MLSLPLFPLLPAPRKPATDTARPSAIIIPPAAVLPALPAEDIARAVNFARQDKAESTCRAYRADFDAFAGWCTRRGIATLPASPETVAAYLAAEAEAGRKPSTISRRCAAIGHAHKGGHVRDRRLTDNAVNEIVKAYAETVGLDASTFGAHSLRSGFLTSAARKGASIFKMRDVSRHKSMDVLQAYVRDADLFRDHAGSGLL